MKNILKAFGIIAVIGFSFAACSGGDDGITTIPVTGVTLNQEITFLTVGSSATLTTTVTPNNATNKAVTWSTSDAAAVTVANGVVTAVAVGSATITVTTADGNKIAVCSITVYAIDPGKTPITNTEINITAPTNGGTPATTIDGTAEHFTAGTVAWSPNDNSFKSDTEYTATVTLTAKDGYTFTASDTATVNGQTATISNITGETVTLSYKFPATSTKLVSAIAIKSPPTKLTYTHGDTLDLAGMVVTLTYDDTTTEDVAAANFTVKGITTSPSGGDNLARSTHNGKPITITYGSLTKTIDNLTINAKNVSTSTFTIDPIPAQTYTGSEIKPVVTMKNGVETLTLTADYTVSYSNNTVAGTATVTVTGTGDYTGNRTINFTINKTNPTVTTWPSATAITYGAALSASVLTGGVYTTSGTFAWTTPATIPTVSNSGYSVTFTPADTANYNTATKTVNITVSKANPSITAWPSAAAIVYFDELSTSTLSDGASTPPGTFAWTNPTTHPSVGIGTYSVTFTPTDTANYNTVTGTVSITVNKRTPVLKWPTAAAITYGAALSASALSGGIGYTDGTFEWTNPETIPTVSNSGYSVTFTPTANTNIYDTATRTVSITVSKATPSITAWPTAAAITYGAALSESSLSGSTETPTGTFSWTAPATIPTVSNSGYSVTFTPTDTANYNTVTNTVNITVTPVNLSGEITISPNSGVIITNTQLTATYSGSETVRYQWKNGASNVGTNSNKYTPTETGSYTVTVSAINYNSKTSGPVTVVQWKAVDSTFDNTSYIKGVANGNDMFVAVGDTGKMAYTTNGTTWTAIPRGTSAGTSRFSTTINAIAYGDGKFVAVGDNGKMAYSTNGTTWTAVADSKFGTSNNNIKAIAYGNGTFVAGGMDGKLAYSTNGTTWSGVAVSRFGTTQINAIAYGNNMFVAAGDNGKMAYSTNGVTWTWTAVADSKFGTTQINAIAYGNNMFVAGGMDGKMAYSTDGTTWTAIPPGTGAGTSTFGTTQINAITYGNNTFVAVGSSGKLAYSTDGTTWTAGSLLGVNIYAIAYGNYLFFAGGDSGKMAYLVY